MFKVGKVLNYYPKIEKTIVSLTGDLTIGDKIKIYKDGELILYQEVDKIILNQKSVDFAKAKDVIALELNEKIQKGSEVFRIGSLGT